MGSKALPLSSMVFSFVLGLLICATILFCSAVAVSRSRGNLIKFLGSLYFTVIVLPSGSTVVTGCRRANTGLLILVTTARLAFRCLTETMEFKDTTGLHALTLRSSPLKHAVIIYVLLR